MEEGGLFWWIAFSLHPVDVWVRHGPSKSIKTESCSGKDSAGKLWVPPSMWIILWHFFDFLCSVVNRQHPEVEVILLIMRPDTKQTCFRNGLWNTTTSLRCWFSLSKSLDLSPITSSTWRPNLTPRGTQRWCCFTKKREPTTTLCLTRCLCHHYGPDFYCSIWKSLRAPM